MKATSDNNLNLFSAKLKAWVRSRKIKNTNVDSGLAPNTHLLSANGIGGSAWTNSLPVITTAPTANNSNGIIICILSSEPSTKYDGYLYIITGV